MNFDTSRNEDGVDSLQLHPLFVLHYVSSVHGHLTTDRGHSFFTCTGLNILLTCTKSQQLVFHLERVSQDEDDDFELPSHSEGCLVQDLLAAPALLLERVAHDTLRPAEPRVKVKRHVGPRLHTAATREVYLEPARQRTGQDRPSVSPQNSPKQTLY